MGPEVQQPLSGAQPGLRPSAAACPHAGAQDRIHQSVALAFVACGQAPRHTLAVRCQRHEVAVELDQAGVLEQGRAAGQPGLCNPQAGSCTCRMAGATCVGLVPLWTTALDEGTGAPGRSARQARRRLSRPRSHALLAASSAGRLLPRIKGRRPTPAGRSTPAHRAQPGHEGALLVDRRGDQGAVARGERLDSHRPLAEVASLVLIRVGLRVLEHR